MKSKTSLINGKLYGDAIKRNWWFGFIVFMAFLFIVTVDLAFSLRRSVEMADMQDMQRLLTGYFFGEVNSTEADLITAMLFGAAGGIVFYSYLHFKRQVDFFHGQPVRRETLLITRFLAGATLFAAGYLINLLFAYFILLGYGASPAIFAQLLMRFGVVLIGFMMLFAFSALSAVLTGNVFAHLQAGFMLCFGPLLMIECLLWFAHTYLLSFSMINESVMYYSSAPIRMVMSASEMKFGVGSALCYILITAAVLALALYLYQKRPSEATGAMFAFPAAEPIYRAMLVVMAGSLMGSIFYDSSAQSMPFTILGVLLGMFLAHIFCQGQYKRSFGGMFSAWKPYAITAAAYLLVMMAFVFDIAGYDTFLPAQEELASVAVRLYYQDSTVYVKNEAGEFENVVRLEYADFDDADMQRELLAMAKAGIESNTRHKANKKNVDLDNGGYGSIQGYVLRYTLANGKQVQRKYDEVFTKDIKQELKALYTAPAFISKEQLFHFDADNYRNLTVYGQNGEDYHNPANKEEKEQFVKALMADIAKHGILVDQVPVAWVDAQCKLGRYGYSMDLYIYESYENCMALLRQWEIGKGVLPEAVIEKLVRAEIEHDAKGVVYTTDDPNEIRRILESNTLVNNAPGATLISSYSARFYTQEYLDRIAEEERQNLEAEDEEYYGEHVYAYPATGEKIYSRFSSYGYRVLMDKLQEYGVTE